MIEKVDVSYQMTPFEKLLLFLNQRDLKKEFFDNVKKCGWNPSVRDLVDLTPLHAVIGNAFNWHDYGGNDKWKPIEEEWKTYLLTFEKTEK